MPELTNRRDSNDEDGGTEIGELKTLRLSRNWSYAQLAADMERVGHPVAAKALHALLTNEGQRPYDRTLYQIREYLAAVREEAQGLAQGRH